MTDSSHKTDDYAHLSSRAASDAARRLVDRLYADATSWERKSGARSNGRRATTAVTFRDTLERLVGDLLRAEETDDKSGFIYRALRSTEFTGGKVSFRNYTSAHGALAGLRLITVRPAVKRFVKFDDFTAASDVGGKITGFRATPTLRHLAAEYGVTADSLDDHFHLEAPSDLLVLKEASLRQGRTKTEGTLVPYPETALARKLIEEVRALNEFLSGFAIRNAAHYGYRRTFHLAPGEAPEDFKWRHGGRLYSVARNSYQSRPADERAQITISGEAVAEIDIRACNLVIFLASQGMKVDPQADPYARVGIDRNTVKTFLTAAFGAGRFPEKWSREMAAKHLKAYGARPAAKVGEVRNAVLLAYPELVAIGSPGTRWADLMWLESQAVTGAMLTLMRQGIPSLSIYDSLIVPVSRVGEGAEALRASFVDHVGVLPGLKTDSALQGVQAALAAVQGP